jgi:hypothetical protein
MWLEPTRNEWLLAIPRVLDVSRNTPSVADAYCTSKSPKFIGPAEAIQELVVNPLSAFHQYVGVHMASPTIIPLEYCFNPEELTSANPVNFASTPHPAIV